eukprot:TRINITY_DN3685_c0_g1_i3.p1 TRINITY_DN3685_c0_g1~~TRINITY_DN3685_c0_g1_i3.p1  ORF type:complete len:542 (-),score=71.69 TRINITY_DN3685_c0_g1_i3:16-1641(-)
MRLRFDDTNPVKEKGEFVESILEDLKTLGITWSKLTYTTDYFDQMFDLLRKMIKENKAYVDNTPVEKMREERIKKIDSQCREFTPDKNLEIFESMLKGENKDYCVRAKINMQSNNGCMRDPVIARPSDVPHHRVGTKYKVYPTYDFACPVVDSVEGVTHVLRTNEYADRIPQYMWMLDALGWPRLEIYEYSRLNFEYTVLSKRKLNWFVNENKVEGWNDPRFPTLRGVLRKGVRVETLIEFMLEQGPSKRSNLMEWEKLWAINKRIIDPVCPRYSAVSVNKACRLEVVNGPEQPEAVSVEMSKLNKDLGKRPLWKSRNLLIEFDDAENILKVGEKVTLMNWGNFKILTKEVQADGSYNMTGEYLPEDLDFKTTKKITWLADNTNLQIVNLIEYDHLIKTKKVEEDVKFEDVINVNSKFVSQAYADSGVRQLEENCFFQFERRGYYRIDKIAKNGEEFTYDMIFVPDGKAVGLSSIAKQTDKKGDIAKESLADKVEAKKNKDKKKKKGESTTEQAQEAKKETEKEIVEAKKDVPEAPADKKE